MHLYVSVPGSQGWILPYEPVRKESKLSHTTQFMADSRRETVKAAVAGISSDSTIQGTSNRGYDLFRKIACSGSDHSHNLRLKSSIKVAAKSVMKQIIP